MPASTGRLSARITVELSEITLSASPERPSKLCRSPVARYSLILAALQFSQWAACSIVMAMSRMKISNSIAGPWLGGEPFTESTPEGAAGPDDQVTIGYRRPERPGQGYRRC